MQPVAYTVNRMHSPDNKRKYFTNQLRAVQNLDLSQAEKARPYLGEKWWLLFFIYQAFSQRPMLKLLRGKERGKFYYWDKDLDGKPENIFAQLSPVISIEEVTAIMKLPEFQVVSAIRNTIELR